MIKNKNLRIAFWKSVLLKMTVTTWAYIHVSFHQQYFLLIWNTKFGTLKKIASCCKKKSITLADNRKSSCSKKIYSLQQCKNLLAARSLKKFMFGRAVLKNLLLTWARNNSPRIQVESSVICFFVTTQTYIK